MKKVYALLIGLFLTYTGFSQSCLPEGITFTSQAQVDSFQVNYPNCTEIEGDVIISDNWSGNIANLTGLSPLTSIGGNLTIYCNNALTNLTGLNNLLAIGQNLFIGSEISGGNPSLISLTGLNNLTNIGLNLEIWWNESLTCLTGLESLISIQNDLIIKFNDTLSSLTGLEGLTYIGGETDIAGNNVLISLTGLDNLATIENSFWIGDPLSGGNPSLTELTALSNLTFIGGSLSIWDNDSLSSLTGLEALSNARHLIINLNSVLSDITALDGLTSFTGAVNIIQNFSLSDLNGLQNVTSIGGELYISQNTNLSNLDGLEGLTTVGGDFYIGKNHFLENLNGISGLTSIGGKLTIEDLYILTSLNGIDSIDAGSIDELIIRNNHSLSTCDVQSICDYLASLNGTSEIHDNATGCNSQEEVEAACLIGVEESAAPESHLTIFPNPSSTTITIALPTTTPVNNTALSIYNVNAQQVISRRITEPQTVIDINTLSQGVYFVRITTDRTVRVGKFVKTVGR